MSDRLRCGGMENGFRGVLGDGAAIGAEVEALNTFVERGAVAVREAAHEFFEAASAHDEFAKFDCFAGGEFLPARADRSGFADAA